MAQIAIAVKYTTPGLKKRLEDSMLSFRNAGYNVSVGETKIDQWPHFLCELQGDVTNDGSTDILFRRCLAESLADFVIQEQVTHYLDEILGHYYFYFPRNEREQILALAKKNYESEQIKHDSGHVNSEVQSRLKDYLGQNGYVNLHGFTLFRLRAWLNFLRKNVDKAVDDFLMEKEYQEFIKLLKYFVTLQEPKINQVHVTLDKDGHVQLLDHQLKSFEVGQQGIAWDGYDSVCDEEDQLVSLLITAAPHQVVLHKQVYTLFPKAVDTLKHVFENRVTLCKRCKLCQNDSKNLIFKGKVT